MFRSQFLSLAVVIFVVVSAASPLQGQLDTAASQSGARQVQPTALTRADVLVETQAVPLVRAAAVDREAVAVEDEEREMAGFAPRFAIANPVLITPQTNGVWEKAEPGTLVWRLRVSSPGAASLNLGFTRYHMPEGGRLLIYAADMSKVVRPFTARDNAAHGELWTPIVRSDEIVVEVTIPESSRDKLELELTSINVGYRGFGEAAGLRSGACNIDVVCPEGDGWLAEISTVAVLSRSGSSVCTGFMVNNTSYDRTPYFITAEHCGVTSSNASTVVVYWNYETSVCDGTPDGSLNDFQSGSYFRATYDPSDFTLVELDEMPASDWNVGYAGWDRTGDDASMAVAIHHPGVDEKRISFEYQATSTTTYLGDTSPGDGTHVRVDDWDLGTTEGGSSGSPLFDQNHRVIGQLHGGYAACGNDEPDWYGKFSISWSGGGTSSSRLSDWLDSSGTGAWDVDTISGFGMDVSPGADVEHLGPMGGPFTNPSVVYTLSNHSADSINYEVRLGAGTAPLLIDGGTSLLTGTLPANGGQTTVTVTLDAPESLNAGVYTREVIFDDVTNDREQTRLHTIDVGQILISVAPEQGLETGGPTGGPFNGSINYTVTSERPSPVNVRVSANQSWISLNGVAGPLMLNLNGLGDSDDVLVGISSTAESLSPGIYNATVSFTNLSSGQGDTTRNITLEVGRVVFVAGDVPQSITDHNTTTSTINVPDNFCIGDVDVDINITHTWIGDLTVELESPSGTVVRLHDGTGGSDEDIVTTYDDDGEGTAPDGPGTLADFDYTATAGAWTLTVTDGFGGDTGTLNSWSLSIAVLGVTCPPHAFDGSVSVLQYVTSDITLTADSLAGNPLDYIIESLPSHGILSDPDGGTITSAPYTLLNHGDVTRFTPDPIGYAGNDSFTFSVYDGQASNIATISVTVGGPQLAYEWLLDTSPGWTTQGDWAFGVPGGASGDPSSGHTGNNVYGYNLGGDYDDGLDPPEYLTSLPIDCSGLSDVEVKFWRWLGVEQADYDHARFQASNNGSSWTTIWENPAGYDNSMNETSWSQHAYDISAIADDQPTVYLRWSMGNTDSTVTYHGWNIDDIEIWAVGAGQETCDDGILNQDEVLIDCGGSCPPCDCLNDPDCDDGAFCTGIETCDAYGECRAGDAPCGLDEWCDEGSDSCITYGSGDLDSDGDVDLDDFAAFQICFGQWASGGCEAANMSGDGMIDLSDYTEFTSVLDGPA